MKNYLLKSTLAMIIAITVIVNISAPCLAKSNVMAEAHDILYNVSRNLDDFLDPNKPGTYKYHAEKLKPMLKKIKDLVKQYQNDHSAKGKAIYKILKKLDTSFDAIYTILTKDYSLSLTLGMALRNVVNQHLSSAQINELKRMLENLQPLLTPDEKQDLQKVMAKLRNFAVKMPSNPLCLLSKRMRG